MKPEAFKLSVSPQSVWDYTGIILKGLCLFDKNKASSTKPTTNLTLLYVNTHDDAHTSQKIEPHNLGSI